MSFSHRRLVAYAEVDQQGVVFHGHWLAFFDDAMTRFLASLGFPPAETFASVFDVMVVRASLEWHGPAAFDDAVDITVTPVRLGTSSFDLRYDAAVAGAPVCTGTVTYVSVKPGGGGSRPIPEAVRRAFAENLPGFPE